MYRIYGISGAMDGKERYVQDVRSAYSSRQKLSTYLPVSNGKERYVQDVRSVFLFPTKTNYLPPCKQVAVPRQTFFPDNF